MEATPILPLFRWSGLFIGFLMDGCLFDPAGRYLGWEDPAGRVWGHDGSYLGERVDDHYVLRRLTHSPPVPQPRRVPPVVPELPLPPAHRAARPPRPGWADALEPFGLRPSPEDLVGEWRNAQERMRFLADGRYELHASRQPPQQGEWELRGNLYLTPDRAPEPASTPPGEPGAAPVAAPRRWVFAVLSYAVESMTLRQITQDRSLPFTMARVAAPW